MSGAAHGRTADGAEEKAAFEAFAARLADPATHHGETPRRIDTHTAAVFLAGEHEFAVTEYCRAIAASGGDEAYEDARERMESLASRRETVPDAARAEDLLHMHDRGAVHGELIVMDAADAKHGSGYTVAARSAARVSLRPKPSVPRG